MIGSTFRIVIGSYVVEKAESMSDIHNQIEKERDQAREVCEIKGDGSAECAAAWDAVEELQAEAAHQRQRGDDSKTSFEKYCDANPEADECRVYDN